MKLQLKPLTTCLTFLTLVSCGSSGLKEREVALKEKELELKQKELNLQAKAAEYQRMDTTVTTTSPEVPQTAVKYMYVVITTNEPKIVVNYDDIGTDREKPFAKPQYFNYTSDIIQVDDYSEDKKFMEIDRYEKKIRPSLVAANRKIEFQNQNGSHAPVNAEAKVVSRNGYVFDTYKEASIQREKAMDRNE